MKANRLLAVIVVLQALTLAGQWLDGPRMLPAANGQMFNSAADRQEIIDQLKSSNSKLDRLIGVLESGKLQVQVTESDQHKDEPPRQVVAEFTLAVPPGWRCRWTGAEMSMTRIHRGFTLIEILTVVVILGIVGAVIVPSLGSRDDLRAAAAARQVMADLIYAQNRAISTQQKHYVQFAGNTYTISSRPDDTSTLATITHPVTKSPYVQTLGAAGTALSSVSIGTTNFGGKSWMGFDELGSPFYYDQPTNTITSLTTAGSVPLNSGTFSVTIKVEPYTGNTSTQ